MSAFSGKSGVDAVVVGSGPNGLAAALTLANAGRSVVVYESADEPGGGMRSSELTLAGFVHDVCSAVHPTAAASLFFKSVRLDFEFVHPPAAAAHPLPGGRAAVIYRSLAQTADCLGADRGAYLDLMTPLVKKAPALARRFLGPALRVGPDPLAALAFARHGLKSATDLSYRLFQHDRARALFAGLSAHSVLPLTKRPSAAFGIFLALAAHAYGWPVIKGGSGELCRALCKAAKAAGVQIVTAHEVTSLARLPKSKAVLFDTSAPAMADICRDALPAGYLRKLRRLRYGPGVFKIDWALDRPAPWEAAECREAATLHLGGTMGEIASAEEKVARGEHPERPFVLFAQPSLFDPSRAPAGRHTAWAYCHVPPGSAKDMAPEIEDQVERFAPGFKDTILARSTLNAVQMQNYNPNFIGGDISGGEMTLRQIVARPALRLDPYKTPNPKLFLCSSSTPPGAGVHGMCGYHAAQSALSGPLR